MDRRSLLTLAAGIPALRTGSDSVARTAETRSEVQLSVKQFGATGDGKTDDYPALQRAITTATVQKKELHWPRGVYRTSGTLLKPWDFFSPHFIAELGTVIDGSEIPDGPTLKIKGGSGQLARARIQGFDFICGDGQNSTGLEIADQCGVDVQTCAFKAGTWGLTYHNENGFTEYVQAIECDFSTTLSSGALRYRVSGGVDSFNGSGLIRSRIVMGKSAHAILIGAGAFLYHAPLDFQLWVEGPNKTIIVNNSSHRHLTHGTITVEVSKAGSHATAPELFGGAGQVSYHQGDITTLGIVWLGPKVNLSGSLNKRMGPDNGLFNGSTAMQRHKFAVAKKLGPGDTALRSILDMGSCIAHIHISAPNYDYRYIVAAGIGVNGKAGVATIIATLSTFNASAFGAPSFSVNKAGDLIITNDRYTASYVAYIVFLDLGPSLFNVGPSMADYKPS